MIIGDIIIGASQSVPSLMTIPMYVCTCMLRECVCEYVVIRRPHVHHAI